MDGVLPRAGQRRRSADDQRRQYDEIIASGALRVSAQGGLSSGRIHCPPGPSDSGAARAGAALAGGRTGGAPGGGLRAGAAEASSVAPRGLSCALSWVLSWVLSAAGAAGSGVMMLTG